MVISSRNRHGGKASQLKRSISRAEKQAKQPSKSPIKTMRLAAKVTGWSACLVGDLPINNHSGPFIRGMRACHTCHHLKRPEIDHRLAAGEPLARVAPDYGLTTSSLYRHRTNCLKLASSNAIAKEAARGTAALTLLPSKETLSGAYLELRDRIDQIVTQAQQQGSLAVAVSGLNSLRQTLDSLARLAGHDRAQVNVAVQANVNVDVSQIVERLIAHFDHEPETKARIAQALVEIDHEQSP
jgi:hypothetical protein